MEFGKLPRIALDQVDFTLPNDGVFTNQVLNGIRVEQPQVYFGGPRWGEKAWIGKIYPKGTKDNAMLRTYANSFGCIELNATHYQIYPETQLSKWANQVEREDFKFCPKVTNSISHYSDLGSLRARELTTSFLSSIQGFGHKLGPLFLQLSEKYTPQRKEALLQYLEHLPRDIQVCLELRHEEWFSNENQRKWLFEHLYRLGIGTVLTDVSGRRDCLHMELTTSYAMVRFVANDMHPTDFKRANDWIERIDNWISRGLKELYFFVHQPNDVMVPELADYFIERLNERSQLTLPRMQFVERQGELF